MIKFYITWTIAANTIIANSSDETDQDVQSEFEYEVRDIERVVLLKEMKIITVTAKEWKLLKMDNITLRIWCYCPN